MPLSLDHFIENVILSGLMSVDELAVFQGSLPPERQPRSPQDLARELILAGKLTRFQAEKVYQGKTRGLVFDEYTILDRLGAGGMGQVYRAEHHTMGRIVALKMLPPKMMDSPEAVRRFQREVRTAARLLHPNIVTAFDAREHDGVYCLVMEYVDGQDLATLVKENGPMPVESAVECILQAARGLEYAHGENVVHRDVKPSNLLVDKKGTVKILDMGLARVFGAPDQGSGDRLTGSGQMMGTCDYLAPEQAENTRTADCRADVYSLGCTFFRLLTGSPPYTGDSMLKILLAHREAPIPSLCDDRGDVSPQLDAVCRKMLAKRPEDRYQSMTEVIAALETCMTGRQVRPLAGEVSGDTALTSFLQQLSEGAAGIRRRTAAAEEKIPSLSETAADRGLIRKPPAGRRHVLIFAVAVAVAVLLAALLLGLVLRKDAAEETQRKETLPPAGPRQDGPARQAPLVARGGGIEQPPPPLLLHAEELVGRLRDAAEVGRRHGHRVPARRDRMAGGGVVGQLHHDKAV